jgi:predicted RNA-binding protein YlxR (DUF448 family)
VRPKRELLRVVRTPDGRVVPDETGRLAGRGAYVCRSLDCIDRAIAKGALGRALKTPTPTGLREALAEGITTTSTTTEGGARGQE